MSISAMLDEHYSVEEFSELEMATPFGERWELINGRIHRMMTGGTIAHNRIARNISRAFDNSFVRGRFPCEVFTENVKLESVLQDSALYPDVLVTCEPLQNDSTKILYPVIIVEVVSKSSVVRDRRAKFSVYAKIPSLKYYIIVEQVEPLVEFWSRPPSDNDDTWIARRVNDLGGNLFFPEFKMTLSMAEIYERVFDANPG